MDTVRTTEAGNQEKQGPLTENAVVQRRKERPYHQDADGDGTGVEMKV